MRSRFGRCSAKLRYKFRPLTPALPPCVQFLAFTSQSLGCALATRRLTETQSPVVAYSTIVGCTWWWRCHQRGLGRPGTPDVGLHCK
ncbi:hypothetical protein CVT26_000813 [Gymnopilus dilepis]|uniref:Uncharacterized protein n=1 Tax=Gymnopilus dilepis TaxID=231916 RepID=A0A409WL60_9AGAR|nr:hypothetical protein CVT26_000813 [Gymnopilus dilepis]